jgi:large conductance mechanosensitive channel
MFKQFREFALRGSVVDLAVGLVIGAAFGRIVESFVTDLLMPPIGLVVGKTDFTNLFVVLRPGTPAGPYATLAAAKLAGATTWNYGLFVNALVMFIIVAFALFLVIRVMNKARRSEPAAPPREDVTLLREIRDELRVRPGSGFPTRSEDERRPH